uniref:Uncharacterized protein n=1 Tax=Rhizophora mucronata TaxID=61149 RepID=A0A2P2JIT9_RHIMU
MQSTQLGSFSYQLVFPITNRTGLFCGILFM